MKIYHIYQWFSGYMANGEMDRQENIGLVLANNEEEAKSLIPESAIYIGKEWSEPYIDEVGEVTDAPVFLDLC